MPGDSCRKPTQFPHQGARRSIRDPDVANTRPAPIPNSYWLPGEQILAGEYPGAQDARASSARLELFLDAGITSFIDLTSPGELVPYEPLLRDLAARRGLDVHYQRLSIRDLGVPTREHMHRILDLIEAEQAAGRTVYVHCWGGVGRTGTVVGCHFVRCGLDGKAALAQLAELWRTVEKCDWCPDSPESDEQRAFVLDWPGRQKSRRRSCPTE
jgi:protein-tyrosine phosphatase